MDIQLKKGLLEYCVLAVLSSEDSYGYRIIGDIATTVPISESTLYPILKRLESGGCLETYTMEAVGRLRKYYRITDAGRQRLAVFSQEWAELEQIHRFVIHWANKKEVSYGQE